MASGNEVVSMETGQLQHNSVSEVDGLSGKFDKFLFLWVGRVGRVSISIYYILLSSPIC